MSRALVAGLPFVLAGLAITLCLPSFDGARIPRRLAYGYLFGVAWIGIALFAGSHLLALPLSAPLVWGAVAIPVAGAAGRLLAGRRRGGDTHEPRRRRTPARRRGAWAVVALMAGGVTVALVADAITLPVRDWDGRMTWCTQAKFFRAERSVDARFLAVSKWFATHPHYPPLLPLAQVGALTAAATEDERAFRPLYAGFFPVLLVLVAEGCRRWAGSRAALAATLTAITLPFLSFELDGGARGAYSDLPLACLIGGGFLLLFRARPRPLDGLASGLLLAGATLTKNEGLPEALAVVAIAGLSALSAWRRGRPGWHPRARAAAAALAPVGGVLLLLTSWRAAIPNRFDEHYAESLSTLARRLDLDHAAAAGAEALRQMLALGHWGALWVLTPIVFAAGGSALRRRPSGSLFVLAAVPLLLGGLAYSVQPDAAYYARVTWNRLLVQGSAPGLILLGFALRGLTTRRSSASGANGICATPPAT